MQRGLRMHRRLNSRNPGLCRSQARSNFLDCGGCHSASHESQRPIVTVHDPRIVGKRIPFAAVPSGRSFKAPSRRDRMPIKMSRGSGSGGPSKPSLGVIEPFDPGPSVARAMPVLTESQTPFALIGGLALEAWGIARATKDIDFAIPVGVAEGLADRLKGARGHARPLRIKRTQRRCRCPAHPEPGAVELCGRPRGGAHPFGGGQRQPD